jgi:hypothetical protein
MTTANTALRVTELDFDSIKNNLKTYLRSQTEFQDFDFEGSGMGVLLDILAYNTHYMGYYLNMTANEMFLDTAQLRGSVLSHAKMINYIPTSRRGAKAVVNIQVTPSITEDRLTNTITIPKYKRFVGSDIDGQNYGFVTLSANVATKSANTFIFSNVAIYQGDVVTRQFIMDPGNTKRSFTLPTANIDTSTLTVTVQESTSNTFTSEYFIVNDITSITSNAEVYFIEENQDLNYTIYFGDDVIGKKPKNGSVITATYLDTIGEKSNNISKYVASGGIAQYTDNVSITSIQSSFGGREKETIEQVKFRAPYYFATQNRAVTADDYAAILTKDYQNIDSVSVWGGEQNDPPVYGKVYISLKMKNNFYLTNIEKETIKQELISNRNVLTVTPEIIDPDYTFILINGNVYYNPALTTSSVDTIRQYVIASVVDYEAAELNRFDSTFRKSKLQNYVEAAEKSITGSEIRVYLQKRVVIDPAITTNYYIQTKVPIKRGDLVVSRISSFPQINVYDASSVLRPVFFEEVPEVLTGLDSITVKTTGQSYTSVPTITIIGDGSGATATAKVVGGRVTGIAITNPGTNYTRAAISITGGNGSGASATSILQSKTGRLRTYYNRTTGEKIVVNENAGLINYETGLIQLTSLNTTGTVTNDLYDSNVLTFNIPIDREVITPLRNRILSIDQNNPFSVQLQVVPEA